MKIAEPIDSKVICGFPGIGKSSYWTSRGTRPGSVVDSDSSLFSWVWRIDGLRSVKTDERNINFPANYIEHIQEHMGWVNDILVSSHKDVRNALVDAEIPFTLIFPDIDDKKEYVQRYVDRGSPEALINLINQNWNDWILDCQNQKNCTLIQLEPGQFLSDVMPL